MNPSPLVSVIIPTYFRNERLEEAIESVISNTYKKTNIVVVDDSGERHAHAIAEKYNIDYIPHDENMGGNEARNTGIQAAEGDYIQLLDDDDLLFETKIEEQINLLQSSPDVGVAYCGIIDRSGEEVLPPNIASEETLEHALKFSLPTAFTSSLLIESQYLQSVYPLTDRNAADDIGMKIELAKLTNFDYVNKPLVEIRESTNNRSDKPEFADELENIVVEYESLYNQYPRTVRSTALATVYESRAFSLLQSKVWSPSVTFNFGKALYYSEGFDLRLGIVTLASIFGKPGIELAANIRDAVFD